MTDLGTKSERIAAACELLEREGEEAAARFLRGRCRSERGAPIPPSGARPALGSPARTERKYSALDKTRLFLRDGFRDRYSGDRLVFPGVMRLLSHVFPNEFSYHPNWKYGVCHAWYWELYPTVDHVDATGENREGNWVTTSMIRNLKKSNLPIAQHGWSLRPPESTPDWDGLLRWYASYLAARPALRRVPSLREWYRAAVTAMKCA